MKIFSFIQQDVEKLTLENRGLKEEANKAQNEVVDLRSEVRKLRYSPIVSTAEEKKRQADQKNMALKSEMNMLQHENEDLKKLVGSLKYGSHPGNADGGCQQKLSGKVGLFFETYTRGMKKSLINDVRYIEVQINLFFTLPYIYCIFEEI